MSKYVGIRHPSSGAAIVSVVDGNLAAPLDAGYRYMNQSPTGFDWGYVGSGPYQLAFGILLDYYSAPGPALLNFKDFAVREIATINGERWEMTTEQIASALKRIRIFRSHANSEAKCPDTT